MPEPLQILHITDLHLMADQNALMAGKNIHESFDEVLKAARLVIPDPDLVAITGDLSHDTDKADYLVTYTRLAKTLKQLFRKSVCIPGNHDDTALVKRIFPLYDIHAEGVIVLDNWKFSLVDSTQKNSPAGFLSDSELSNLDRSLTNCHSQSPEAHSLILIHHPVVDLKSQWLDQQRTGNADQLFELLARKKNIQGILCGHAHQAYDVRVNNLEIMGTPAACPRQFAPLAKNFCVDETVTPGFRTLTLYPDGEINTQVHRL